MARDYAQIRQDMWLDDDWRGLTVGAQHLYMLLLSDPKLSYAGVTDFRPGAIRQRAAEWSLLSVMTAAVELSYAYFLVFDQETEEVFIRSYLRHDSLMKNPRMAVSMAKDFGAIGSNKIRAALVHEVTRLKRENPDWGAWEKPQVKTLLRQNAVSAREMEVDLDMPLGVGLPITVGKPEGEIYQPSTTATATATTTATFPKGNAAAFSSSYPQGSRTEMVGTANDSGRGDIS